MRKLGDMRNPRSLIITCVALLALAALPLLSRAKTTITTATSVKIVNNSSKDIRNVYLSHVNLDDWGSNQLGDATLAAGQSFTLNDVACDQQQVKVIGEDQDGCFLSTVVNCSDSATWTITNDTARDCGGN
jgi:putative NIF3 family GTP cyclohydrolase 1 type 2